jgi:isocitrate dehydrogenase kinase/phosphatase
MSDDWAKKAVEAFKTAKEQRENRDAKALLDDKLKKTLAPQKWATVRELLHKRMDAFNAGIGASEALIWTSILSKEAIVRIKDDESTLVCTYNQEEHSITVACSLISRTYHATVVNNDVVFRDSSNRIVSLEEIAEGALDSLLTFLAA